MKKIYLFLITCLFCVFNCTTDCLNNQIDSNKTTDYNITFHYGGLTVKSGYSLPTKYNEYTQVVLPTDEFFDLDVEQHILWFDNPDFNGNFVTTIPKGSKGDKKFWVTKYIIFYNIKFHYDGFIIKEGYTLPTQYNESMQVSLPTDEFFDLSDDCHICWYDNADLTGDVILQISEHSKGNKEFWIKQYQDYKITYHYDGLTIKSGCTLQTKYNEYMDVILPIGQDFNLTHKDDKIYWYDNPDLSGDYVTTIPKGQKGNKEFWGISGVYVRELDDYLSELKSKQDSCEISIIDVSPDLMEINRVLKNASLLVSLDLTRCLGLTTIKDNAFNNCDKLERYNTSK